MLTSPIPGGEPLCLFTLFTFEFMFSLRSTYTPVDFMGAQVVLNRNCCNGWMLVSPSARSVGRVGPVGRRGPGARYDQSQSHWHLVAHLNTRRWVL